MTYYNPEKQIPILIDSCKELFLSMESDEVKLNDLEKVWISVFQQPEKYNATHIVACLRMLFESALSASQEFERKDFGERQKDIQMKKELSYQDAAEYLDYSVSRIKTLVSEGRLTPKRYGYKNVKISVQELERFKTDCIEKVELALAG